MTKRSNGGMTIPKGYWIAHIDVRDPERHKAYMAANAKAFEKYGGRFLVSGGRAQITAGAARERQVVIELSSLSCRH